MDRLYFCADCMKIVAPGSWSPCCRDRLHVAIGCLEAMDHKQREGAVLAIVRKYHGENVHVHRNPVRKAKEERTA